MVSEAVGIYYRTSAETLAWIGAQHKKPLDLSKATILLTGGNRGLGRGIAGHLASFGARLLLPCRRCPPDLKQQVLDDAREYRALYGGDPATVRDVRVDVFSDFDLADWASVDALVSKLVAQGVTVTVLVANAGLVDTTASRTKQDFELTFGVNFVGSAYLTTRLLDGGVLARNARVVSVSSEDARVGPPIAEVLQRTGKPFGAFWGDGLLDTMDRYMYSKLAQTTWYLALARKTQLQVIDMCPGPVGSDISMSAPWPLDVIVTPVLALLFPTVHRAAIPVVRFAVAPEYANESGSHYHLGEKKPTRADASDPVEQDKVWAWAREAFATASPPLAA